MHCLDRHGLQHWISDQGITTFLSQKGIEIRQRSLYQEVVSVSRVVFQRLMDVVLCGLSYQTCLVYLDDIIVFGRTFEEQLTRLEEVFGRLGRANLKLKPSKCSLCQRSVEFLGHVVSDQGVTVQESKVAAIRDWPVCKTLTEVRAFLGLSGYYRRFVSDYSLIARPLYTLMKKDVEFEWTDACVRKRSRN